MLVRVSNDHAHAGKRRQFLRGALRIAASDENLRFRITAMNSPDRRANFLIGRCSYGACVEDDDFGVDGRTRARQSAVKQLALNRGTISLRCPAAEVFYKERSHPLIIRAELRGFGRQLLAQPTTGLSPGNDARESIHAASYDGWRPRWLRRIAGSAARLTRPCASVGSTPGRTLVCPGSA